MEPLGGVASIFAVLSLALQLGQSALDIKRFLDTISNAPSEVTRLKDVVFQLHSIANSIKTLLNDRQTLQGENSHALDDLYHALRMCQNTLNSLSDVLQRADKVQKGRTLMARSWAQFRFACKKEQIEEFERQLGLTISLLNLHLIIKSPTISAISASPHVPRAAGPIAVIPIVSSRSSASIQRVWFDHGGLNIQYHELSGTNKRYSFILRASIFGSRIIEAQLSGPFFGANPSIPLSLSMRNLIPDDAGIIEACSTGDSERVKAFIESGSARPNDVTPTNYTALSIAIKGGFEEVVQLLLRTGADANLPCGKFQTSPLQVAILFEKSNIARMLMQYGADPGYNSARGWSLLHHLFESGKPKAHTEYFSILSDCLFFDDVKDAEGWTSMHRCAAFGTAEDIHFLHRLGASACQERYRTNCGWSPVHVAALMNNVSTLEALTDLDTSLPTTQKLSKPGLDNLNHVDFNGWTPMHFAADRHAKDTLKWLLEKGADPHRSTYRTAGWFPKGHEGEAFEVKDLAKLAGEEFFADFVKITKEVGYDVTTDGEDVYWEPDL